MFSCAEGHAACSTCDVINLRVNRGILDKQIIELGKIYPHNINVIKTINVITFNHKCN